MSHRIAPAKILFLDQDHALRLIRSILSWDGEEDRNYVHDFFLPDHVEAEQVEQMGAPLRRRHHLLVTEDRTELAPWGPEVLVFRRGVVDRAMLDTMPNLKLIQRYGESPRAIDVETAAARNIAVSCLQRPTQAQVADHVFHLALALLRRQKQAERAFSSSAVQPGTKGDISYNWASITGVETLLGKTFGIIGMGEIGVRIARRAAGFGCRIIFSNRSILSESAIAGTGARQVSLQDLLTASDIVSISAPPARGQQALIGRPDLALMKKNAILINTSRGAQIDEDALFEALQAGLIAGAGLDVHAAEPRGPTYRFAARDDVVLTPHIAGGSRPAVLDEVRRVFENIDAVLAGARPPHDVILPDTMPGQSTQVR